MVRCNFLPTMTGRDTTYAIPHTPKSWTLYYQSKCTTSVCFSNKISPTSIYPSPTHLVSPYSKHAWEPVKNRFQPASRFVAWVYNKSPNAPSKRHPLKTPDPYIQSTVPWYFQPTPVCLTWETRHETACKHAIGIELWDVVWSFSTWRWAGFTEILLDHHSRWMVAVKTSPFPNPPMVLGS